MHSIAQYADWAYLIGAILFILTLRSLSSPHSAVRGNRLGMIGMTIAVVTTFFVAPNPNYIMIFAAMAARSGDSNISRLPERSLAS